MDEIISYKMCAVKVRNAKLRNYLNETHFLYLVCDGICLSANSIVRYRFHVRMAFADKNIKVEGYAHVEL